MRNIICFILLVITTTMYSQNTSISNDDLYLQYEAAYLKCQENLSTVISDLDVAIVDFNSKFSTEKATIKFNKSKDRLKWLSKNFSQTSFINSEQAVEAYSKILEMESFRDDAGKEVSVLLDKLKLKYSSIEIYNTLKSRLIK